MPGQKFEVKTSHSELKQQYFSSNLPVKSKSIISITETFIGIKTEASYAVWNFFSTIIFRLSNEVRNIYAGVFFIQSIFEFLTTRIDLHKPVLLIIQFHKLSL